MNPSLKKYRLVIFDFIDTLAACKGLSKVEIALEQELGKETVEAFIDGGNIDKIPSVDEAMNTFKSITSLSKEQEELVRRWLDWSDISLFEDTIDTLEYLKEKGYLIAIISNSPPSSRDQLADLGIRQYVDEAVFSFEVGSKKPEKEIFTALLNKLHIEPQDALMIGDSIKNDINGANACDIDALLLDRNTTIIFDPKIITLRELRNFL